MCMYVGMCVLLLDVILDAMLAFKVLHTCIFMTVYLWLDVI
jgi:hypothetical protein